MSANVKILEYYGILKAEKKGVKKLLHLSPAVRMLQNGLEMGGTGGEERLFYFA